VPHTYDDIEEQVIEVIAKKRRIDPSALSRDSTFADLDIDSLEAIDLLFTLEDRFQIDIPDGVAQHITTVGQVSDALRPILHSRSAEAS
jgi:acyl carrier protein